MILIAVVLCVLYVAVGILSGAHATSVVLAGVLALVVDARPAHRHHSDVLRHVLFTHKVAHVVFVAYRVFFVLLLLLFDRGQLVLRQTCDFSEHVNDGSILCLNGHALQLLLHLDSDSIDPATDLVIDKLHVLFAIVQAF